MNIKIEHDGKYPCLCMGHLKVWIDNQLWDFGKHSLISGGEINYDDEWNFEIEKGKWDILEFPKEFPEHLKKIVIEKVNEEIPYGCCGGCI
jgi:hypothetical protein